MFAMGGNTQAINSGLADEEKSRRIIQEALKRQETFDVSTISGTILPPYPKNFFRHPLLDDPYEYQNGAQWDWFGGRLIYAMFQQGFSQKAKEKWLEIIRKNAENRGFFEWDNKEGIGRGSDYYAGTAGSMGRALFEGYFGIKLKWNALSIEPMLGKDSARIHIHQPANDMFIAYEYAFDESVGQLSLNYESNLPHEGKLKILCSMFDLWDRNEELKKMFEVQMDDRNIDFDIESKNDDSYIVIQTDFENHIIKISVKNSL